MTTTPDGQTTIQPDASVTHDAGLAPLLAGAADVVGGPLDGRRAGRIRKLIGDRYTISVDDQGIRTRGFLRRRGVAWEDVNHVQLEPVARMAARRVIGSLLKRTVRRIVPIPGLSWLAGKVVGAVVDPAANLAGDLGPETPEVFVAARSTDGEDVDLDGALALTALLARGLTTAIRAQAAARGIPVRS